MTHPKAGSQWIHRILIACAPERIVAPHGDVSQVLRQPIRAGGIYPTVYLTREELESVALPPDTHRFVVVRDLRDTLVSFYFSIKFSHPVIAPVVTEDRGLVRWLSKEEGLLYVMERWLSGCGRIQESWVRTGEPLIRYEDLLERDVEILERVLLEECELGVDADRFREVVAANRFEAMTSGRPRGTEDVWSHERKGVSGDWLEHLHGDVKTEFKRRFGELLVATGYEPDLSW